MLVLSFPRGGIELGLWRLERSFFSGVGAWLLRMGIIGVTTKFVTLISDGVESTFRLMVARARECSYDMATNLNSRTNP